MKKPSTVQLYRYMYIYTHTNTCQIHIGTYHLELNKRIPVPDMKEM